MSDLRPRRAAGKLIGRHAIGFAINFVGTVFIARTLGPTAWGIFSVAYVLQFIVQGLLERGVVGHLIQRRDPPDRTVIGVAFSVQIVTGGIASILAAGLALPAASAFGHSALTPLFLATAASLFAYALRTVPLGLLERELAYGRVAAVEIADIATFNILAVGGILAGWEIMSLAIATGGRAFVSLAVALVVSRSMPVLAWSTEALRDLWNFVGPYSGASALSYLNGAAAPLLVGTLAGPREFGVLQLAYGLIAYPQVLNTILGRVAFPFYARIGENVERVRISVGAATGTLLSLVGGLTVLVALSSPLWITSIYGPDWSGAVAIMITIAPSLAIGTSLTFVVAALNAAGRTSAVLRTSLAFSVAYWIAAGVLVPRIGPLGLPLSYALASSTFILYLRAHRVHIGRIDLRNELIGHVVHAILALAVAWLLVAESTVAAIAMASVVAALWTVRGVPFRRIIRVITWRASRRSDDPG